MIQHKVEHDKTDKDESENSKKCFRLRSLKQSTTPNINKQVKNNP